MAAVGAPDQVLAVRGALKLCPGRQPALGYHHSPVENDVGSRALCAGGGAARTLGLSKNHIYTGAEGLPERKEGLAVVISYTDGSLVSCKREARGWDPPKEKRGIIHGFSGPSRMRMLRKLASLKRDSLPLFVTLTYPRVWNDDYRQWKRNLNAFFEWLKRFSHGRASIVWKLELQDRSAPHFHLLVYGVAFIPNQLLAWVWYRIVASGDHNHLSAGTSIEAIRSWRGVMSYASKRYMGKEWDSDRSYGRCWGVKGRSVLPVSTRRVFYLTADAANRLFRIVRKRSKLDVRSCYYLFVQSPVAWERLVGEVMKE